MEDVKTYHSLPYACSLCGSCTDVCPVKIPLHEQLLDLRGLVDEKGQLALSKRLLMKLTSLVMKRTWLFSFAGKCARFMLPKMPRFLIYNGMNAWGKQRELPPFPKKSFRELYRERNG